MIGRTLAKKTCQQHNRRTWSIGALYKPHLKRLALAASSLAFAEATCGFRRTKLEAVLFGFIFFCAISLFIVVIYYKLFTNDAIPGWATYSILSISVISFLSLGNFLTLFSIFIQFFLWTFWWNLRKTSHKQSFINVFFNYLQLALRKK